MDGYGVFSWVIGGMIERMRGADGSIMLEVYRTTALSLMRHNRHGQHASLQINEDQRRGFGIKLHMKLQWKEGCSMHGEG